MCASKNGSKEISQNAPQIHPNRPPTRHQKGSPRTSLKLSQADLQADSPNVAFVFGSIEFLCICVIWYARQQIQTLGPGTRGNKLGLHSRPTPIIPHPPPALLARLGLTRLSSARLGSARLGSAQLGSARVGSARPGPARLGSPICLPQVRASNINRTVTYKLVNNWQQPCSMVHRPWCP